MAEGELMAEEASAGKYRSGWFWLGQHWRDYCLK